MAVDLLHQMVKAPGKAMEQTDPRRQRTSRGLNFADHMDRLVAGDGAPRTPERAEMLTRV